MILKTVKKLLSMLLIGLFLLSAAACSPKVGTPAWCEMMEQKPKGDWTANEASDYATNCIFK